MPTTISTALNTTTATSGTATLRDRCGRMFGDAVVRNGMLSVFDQAIVSGASFATSVIIGRLCSPNDLGVYYLALSIVLFIRGVQEQIISAPYAVYCHREDRGDVAAYTGSTLVHQLLLLTVTVAGLTVFAVAVTSGFGPAGFSAAAWAVVGAAPLLLFREYLRHVAFGRLALRTAILLDVCVAVIQLGGVALLAWNDRLTVANVYLVMAAACAIAACGWWISRAEPVAFQSSRIVPDWKRNWSFSKWALASHVVGCSTPYVLPWFVAAIDGTAATGLLAACTTLVGLANAFMMGLCNSLTPKAAQSYAAGGVKELKTVLLKTALLFGATIGGFAVFATFAGEWFAVVIYGDDFAGAGAILSVLAFSLLAVSFSMTAGNGLWAMEKPSANFRADVCALTATVIAAVTLTPPFGVLGAAIASLTGAVIGAGIRVWTLRTLMQEADGIESQRKSEDRA